jgi:hypothetical protein
MHRTTRPFVWALAALAMLAAACAPRFVIGDDTYTATVVLPAQERCLYAADGATLTFDGRRLDWTCESPAEAPRGLLGAPIVTAGVNVSWRLVATARAVDGGGYVIVNEELVQGRASQLTLATGETCLFSGEGATMAFDQGRVNYACGGDVVVVGDLRSDPRGLVALRGSLVRADGLEPFRLANPRLERVTSVTLE